MSFFIGFETTIAMTPNVVDLIAGPSHKFRPTNEQITQHVGTASTGTNNDHRSGRCHATLRTDAHLALPIEMNTKTKRSTVKNPRGFELRSLRNHREPQQELVLSVFFVDYINMRIGDTYRRAVDTFTALVVSARLVILRNDFFH